MSTIELFRERIEQNGTVEEEAPGLEYVNRTRDYSSVESHHWRRHVMNNGVGKDQRRRELVTLVHVFPYIPDRGGFINIGRKSVLLYQGLGEVLNNDIS